MILTQNENVKNASPSVFHAASIYGLDFRVPAQLNTRFAAAARQGLSLIEIMIALTMTLIILGAMMTAFQTVSREMQSGRAMIEMANRVRVLETTIRRDMASLTLEPRPYTTTTPPGYFTISEGSGNDAAFAPNPADLPAVAAGKAAKNVIGDVDDYVSMTVQSKGSLFRGRGAGGVIESPLAEVCYFAVWPDSNGNGDLDYDEPVQIRRRFLLILPPPTSNYLTNASWAAVTRFFRESDISARIVPVAGGTFNVVGNRLEDLAIRSNRFGHGPVFSTGGFTTVNDPTLGTLFQPNVDLTLVNRGFPNSGIDIRLLTTLSSADDIVLTDVVGFDVRVFSPNAPVEVNGVTNDFLVEPSDVGFGTGTAVVHGNYGGFVDLGRTGITGWLLGPQDPRAQLPATRACFDTSTPAYESDGIDQDNDMIVDEGTDGLDNDNANGVDDSGERETAPPYMYPVRGIQIQVRVIERLTKQVHQTSIMQSFVPE